MASCNHKTEVYSRCVGFYRPVQSWNDGKQEEYKERKTFDVNTSPKEKAVFNFEEVAVW